MQKLVLRPNATPSVRSWISSSTCWHLDVWLYVSSSSTWYIRALTSVGGELVLGEQWFALVQDTQFGVWVMVPCVAPERVSQELLYSPRGLATFKGLTNDVFWRLIYPLANLWPRGEYKRRSVAFHMVKPIGVVDPCEGVANYYSETARSKRDEVMAARVAAQRENRGE